MKWIHDYQFFLFDFDGLLVNTEEIHFQAYKQMCAARGFQLQWDFNRYCKIAHYEADAIRQQLYHAFPTLQVQEPNWDVLYLEKKQALFSLLREGAVSMMPGAAGLLKALNEAEIPCCVVTNSPNEMVGILREKLPDLNRVNHWITREHYVKPKPHPECYLKAIELLANKEDRVIGFEDTPRGLRALLGTRATPVLICKAEYPEIPEFVNQGVLHFPSILDVSQK